jgi:hypothetical protein
LSVQHIYSIQFLQVSAGSISTLLKRAFSNSEDAAALLVLGKEDEPEMPSMVAGRQSDVKYLARKGCLQLRNDVKTSSDRDVFKSAALIFAAIDGGTIGCVRDDRVQ